MSANVFFYCVFGYTDQSQKNQHNSSTPSWSKFEIEFTIGITVGNAPQNQNILEKALSDGPNANVRQVFDSNMTKVSFIKWSQNCIRAIRSVVVGINK